MKSNALLAFFLLAILGVAVATYWFGVGGQQNVLLENITYVAAPLYAVMGAAYATYVHGWRGIAGLPLILFTIGLTSWFVGESLFVYYDFVVHETPFPSVADIFYLAAYPPLYGALVAQVRNTGVKWKDFDPVIVFLFGIVAMFMIGLVGYFGVIQVYDPSSSLLENGISIAYGVGDLALIIFCLLVLILAWEYKGGTLMQLYMAIFVAFSVTLIADLGFAAYTDQYLSGVHWIKNTLDTLWIFEYVYLGYAFGSFGVTLANAQRRLLAVSRRKSAN